MTPRVLVTGGAGFIGSHTVEWLLEKHYEVTVLDNLSSSSEKNLPLAHPKLSLVVGSVLDGVLVRSLVAQADAVLHLAAIASVPVSLNKPHKTFLTNVEGFHNVIEAIRLSNRNIRLVYASSAAVYGDGASLPCQEAEVLNSKILSPYALHKLHNEQYAQLYRHTYQLEALGLRYFNVYGRRQDPNSPYSGVISRFLARHQENKPFIVFGSGEQSRDFIHVKDVAKANELALKSAFCGVCNIATGQPQSILKLISCIKKQDYSSTDIQFEPERSGDIKASYADTALASHALNFTAHVSLEAGISEFFNTVELTMINTHS